jgi:predicted nucleic acid-binding protein
MRIMVDLNVILDVIQEREPHYTDSAQVVDAVVREFIEGVVASHCVTTLYYVIDKNLPGEESNEALEWLLRHFGVEPAGHLTFQKALALKFPDYEDAVINVLAENAKCDYIVTRNLKDFSHATLPTLSPTQFLVVLKKNFSNDPAD